MTPFLQLLAQAASAEWGAGLDRVCFVFPTRRASQFFLNYLAAQPAPRNAFRILPQALTMAEFCSLFSKKIEASRFDELCLLYNCYHTLSSEIPDFDRFRFWGDMILDDFHDVESYLADADMLFSNVSNYREISSTYLTDEQIEIINRYWPETVSRRPDDDAFWLHLSGDDESADNFKRLWQVLGPLYRLYSEKMEEDGLASTSRIIADASRIIAECGAEDIPFDTVVFVGFSVLSTAELKIFSRLQKLGKGQYYWDLRSPLLSGADNVATWFIRKYVKQFPPVLDLTESGESSLPKVMVKGVPSFTGQATIIADQLDEWRDRLLPADDAVKTAVVLADEMLFVPLTYNLSDELPAVNVAMQVPLRHTPVAMMMRNVVSLQLRARFIKGRLSFFFEDVDRVLRSATIHDIDPERIDSAVKKLRNERRFMIPADELVEMLPELQPLFVAVKDEMDFRAAFDYLTNLIRFLTEHIAPGDNPQRSLDLKFFQAYLNAVETLRSTILRRGVTVNNTTALQLVERLANGSKVRFDSRPVRGLQLLGMQQARGLDFENLVMASMNEKIYPRRRAIRSFIPANIRRAFGLPTAEFSESASAYNFLRLVANASTVTILYDARTSGVGADDMSRYVTQLLYLGNLPDIRHQSVSFPATLFNPETIAVEKSEKTVDYLRRFTTAVPQEERVRLSASALNTYLNCPLEFYFRYIEKVNLEDSPADFMESSTYGTIVHAIVEKIYNDFRGNRNKVEVTSEMLDSVIANRPYLDRIITLVINKEYFDHDNDDTPLTGSTRLLGNLMGANIRMLLRREKALTPFWFVKAEMKEHVEFKVNENLTINTTMIIDRLDRLADGTLRIVDYKTGQDILKAGSVDDLFYKKSQRPKAFLQLMFYANLYRIHYGFEGPIQPIIYKLRDVYTDPISPLIMNKERLTDYRDYNDEFLERLQAVIEQLFDPSVPFTQTPVADHCKFCNFKELCNR